MSDFKTLKEAGEAYDTLLAENKKLAADLKRSETDAKKASENLVLEINAQAGSINELTSDLSEKNARIAELEDDLEAKENLLERQELQLQEMSALLTQVRTDKSAAGKPSVYIDGVEHEITVPQFNFEGEVYTAADLQINKELQSQLLKIKSGILVEKK